MLMNSKIDLMNFFGVSPMEFNDFWNAMSFEERHYYRSASLWEEKVNKDRPCIVCGNYPSACTCQGGGGPRINHMTTSQEEAELNKDGGSGGNK